MYRVYSVEINGRTMEGRNLKELLARAVSAKRNPDRGNIGKSPLVERISTGRSSVNYGDPGMALVH